MYEHYYTDPRKCVTFRQCTGGAKREGKADKPDYTLIPTDMLKRLASHYTKGAQTHGVDNWMKGDTAFAEGCKKSAFRHFLSWQNGETDEDHAIACVWNIFTYEALTNEEHD